MTDLQRVTEVVSWLIFKGIAKNRREISEKIGYAETTFSQIMNGKAGISNVFLKKLSRLSGDLNENWLLTGVGEMLLHAEPKEAGDSPQNEFFERLIIEMQGRNERMDRLIDLLEKKL